MAVPPNWESNMLKAANGSYNEIADLREDMNKSLGVMRTCLTLLVVVSLLSVAATFLRFVDMFFK